MILLLGGTSETASLATGLAEAGFTVLVSTATDVPLDIGTHPNIRHRIGRLDENAMAGLIDQHGIKAIVDAAHPYAAVVHATAEQAAERMGIPYLRFDRPSSISEDSEILSAADHEEAARLAFSFGKPVLLTIGSRNVEPYARESHATGAPIVARVLPYPESLAACHQAGIPDEYIIAHRGPFSVEENRLTIRRFGIGVLVTKDSGTPGGTQEKLDAAKMEGCKVVVVERPGQPSDHSFGDVNEIIAALTTGKASLSSLRDSDGL